MQDLYLYRLILFGTPVGVTKLIKCRSTRRYYRTDQIQDRTYQMQECSDTGVPVGTTEQIRYGQNLFRGRSTCRYYRTDQIQNRTYSEAGVPVGTT